VLLKKQFISRGRGSVKMFWAPPGAQRRAGLSAAIFLPAAKRISASIPGAPTGCPRAFTQQFQVSAYGKLNCKHAGPVGGKKSSLKARRREIARFSFRRHPRTLLLTDVLKRIPVAF
jgi:hypothetical protein